MDDFVLEIKNNIERSLDNDVVVKPTRFREFFKELCVLIILSKPEIKVFDGFTDDGDIRFEVTLSSMGISSDFRRKYKTEFSTDFVTNFIGEILVRENIDRFVKLLISLKENYIPVVNKYNHRKFGVVITQNKCVFAFHSSLIQSILVEDVKNEMK